MAKKYQVLGVGNAIVDVIARVDDSFLEEHGSEKGSMMLVDSAQSANIYNSMPPTEEHSGGSAANTMAGIAGLGGSAAFVGKVKADQLGSIFRHDIKAVGVEFLSAPAVDGPATANCMILVTPDGQRTMHTFLGACVNLSTDDISVRDIAEADVVYFEGYLWDMPQAKKAFVEAMEIAYEEGSQVALTLSDSFCVGRFREEFLDLTKKHVDILFANEDEIKALYKVETFDEALSLVRKDVAIAAITRSEKGCVIATEDHVVTVAAEPTQVVDTTGAGDLFAAGFLFGHTRGYSLKKSGKIGCIAAAEIISHVGARPIEDLAALVKKKLND